MRARLCAYLARCFNAHLSDDEKRIATDLAAARAAFVKFNEALAKLPENTWVHYKNYGDSKYERAPNFRITRLECEFINRKTL